MSDAPERLWADGNHEWDSGSWGRSNEFVDDVEYVRADIVQALTAERDRLAGINAKLCDNFNTLLIDGARLEDRAKAAEEKCDQLREALTRLLAPFEKAACRYDHHGYCQEHFLETDCCVSYAIAALRE